MSKIALIIIDVQKARDNQIPVIYVQHDGGEGDPLQYGLESWEIHDDIAPESGDPIVHKRTPDSFHETNLKDILDEKGIEHVVLAGMQSEMCVDTTCRSASRDYKVTLAADAHSTWTSEVLSAQQIIDHENQTLIWFADVKPESEITF